MWLIKQYLLKGIMNTPGVDEALNLLGLRRLGIDIGESFNSIRIYQMIETQYRRAMAESLGGTSNVIKKKNVSSIRSSYLQLKRCFIEPGQGDAVDVRIVPSVVDLTLAATGDGVGVRDASFVVDLTADEDGAKDEDVGAATLTGREGLSQMIGIRVRKYFWFKGKITHVWSHKDKLIPLWKRKNWHVEYEDGDEEDLLWQELSMYQKDDLCNIELGYEGYEFWKSFELEGTVTKVHQYQHRESKNKIMCGQTLHIFIYHFICILFSQRERQFLRLSLVVVIPMK